MKITKTTMIATIIAGAFLVTSSPLRAECFSEGVRVGSLQKFSQKGIINKSWEGELVLEGFKLPTNGMRGGNVWKFSVLDANIAKAIDNAMMNGNPVALRYCQTLLPLMQTDTGYRITQVVERGAK